MDASHCGGDDRSDGGGGMSPRRLWHKRTRATPSPTEPSAPAERDLTRGRSAGTSEDSLHDPTRGRSAGTIANPLHDPTRGRSAGTAENPVGDPTRSRAAESAQQEPRDPTRGRPQPAA
jgi:hypothetical protein